MKGWVNDTGKQRICLHMTECLLHVVSSLNIPLSFWFLLLILKHANPFFG